jgi:hypothetical protein
MRKFKLAPLTKVVPNDIVPAKGNDNLRSFMLALAVVFNDLKGLMMFRQVLAPLKAPDSEVSSAAGEWRGLEIQLDRYTIALVHELLLLVGHFAAEAQGPDISLWLSKAPPSVRKRWRNIVNVSVGGKGDGDAAFTKILLQVRNNLSSHYYQPKALVAGFRKHFFESSASAVNAFAYASLGKNMERTRFYYADAALQAGIANLSEGLGQKQFAKRLRKLGGDINEALAHLLEQSLNDTKEA